MVYLQRNEHFLALGVDSLILGSDQINQTLRSADRLQEGLQKVFHFLLTVCDIM